MDARVEKVITTMLRRKADDVSVGSLSRSVNLTPARLWQLFKEETGRSPMQYLKALRMQQAEKLLRTTFLSIKEVAFLSRARDLSHFVRDFKKEYGFTPSEFRARSYRRRNGRSTLARIKNEPTDSRFR